MTYYTQHWMQGRRIKIETYWNVNVYEFGLVEGMKFH